MNRWILAGVLATTSAWATAPADYVQQVEQWRSERETRLRQPQGWLSLIGLHWLDPAAGTQSVGSAADNDIVLAAGPAKLGTLSYEEKRVSFTPADGSGVTVDRVARSGAIEIKPDSAGLPTSIGFDGGLGSVQLIERVGRFALRVRDERAPTRTGFAGLQHFAIDPAWRFDARFEPHPEGRTIPIANVVGQLEPMKNPGVVVFEHDGKTHRLEAVDEGDGKLFLIFADRTNGKDTYGAGRFLYADAAVDGRTVVDFNRAYNPPCAFNAYSTCPLPPPENRLDLAVTAGEKTYTGAAH